MNPADPMRVYVVLPRLAMLGLSLVIAARTAWSQTESNASQQPVPAMVGLNNAATPAEAYAPDNSDDRMMTPPPVSGQTYPALLMSEERANYLRGGLSFTGAYMDNSIGAVVGHPISDVSYSVAPTVAVDETTPRLHYLLTYAPGFTFYQRASSLNEADQNASIEFEYRLSPHVMFGAHDGFQKSSNVFNQPPDLASAGVVSGGAGSPTFSVVAPIANQLSNMGSLGLSYQFGLNDMIGTSGTFSNLHFPNPAQVPGLYDSSSQGGVAFYSHRFAKTHYVGVSYQYQRLLSYSAPGGTETQTHSALLFYTFSPTREFSISIFGGPQYSDTVQPPLATVVLPESRSWTPAGGASVGWQGRLNSFALSYSYIIAGGGGLIRAVQLDSASAAFRQQVTKTLIASVTGGYAQEAFLGSPRLSAGNGHSISGTAFVRQKVGEHVSLQLAYTRIHQDYSNVAIIAATPNTNRESVSISYSFSKALGR